MIMNNNIHELDYQDKLKILAWFDDLLDEYEATQLDQNNNPTDKWYTKSVLNGFHNYVIYDLFHEGD